MHTLRTRGFTLIEMVVSITLISLLAVAAAPMLRLPLAGWMDASRRSSLAHAIDAIDSRLRDDMRRAMPNSVRVRQVGARVLLETLELRSWGRHRVGATPAAAACPAACSGHNDALESGCAAEQCFASFGPLQGDPPVAGDWVVVNPMTPSGLAASRDPYFGGNAALNGEVRSRLVSVAPGAGGQVVRINPHRFPSLSPSQRFYVVATPVTWDCDPGTQRLTRRSGYAVSQVQPIAFAGASSALLADRITSCSIAYAAISPVNPRGGQVQLRIQLTALDSMNLPEQAQLSASYAVTEDR